MHPPGSDDPADGLQAGALKVIDAPGLREVSARAAASDRLRANRNLHPQLEDPVQRFLNAVEPGSYVRPHRHPGRGRWELFLALAGGAAVLLFDVEGVVLERVELESEGRTRGVEVPAGAWHALVALRPGTVLFEVKPGPYQPLADKDFAPWAPEEGKPTCRIFVEWYLGAVPGDEPPTP